MPITNNSRCVASLVLCALAGLACAQALRPSGAIGAPEAAAPKGDAIVAVVNQEVVTRVDLARRTSRLEKELAARGAAIPPRAEVEQRALSLLIDEKVQISAAREQGLVVDEGTLDRALQQVAQSNNVRLPELMARAQSEGYGPFGYRESIRDEIVIGRFREREIAQRVRVSEAEVDAFIAEQAGVAALSRSELNLAQLLVAVPERASEQERARLRAKADSLRSAAQNGDFAELSAKQSDASNARAGGEFGWRNAERYPQPFVDAVKLLKTGEISQVVETGAGFHVLKVVGRRQADLPSAAVQATRVRHILLREGDEANNVRRANDFRRQIASGQLKFEDVARRFSQDGSAAQGGDLGVALPRQFVPEFEVAMNALPLRTLSEPVVSRFGVHLIEVLERKQQQLTVKETREQAREVLRDRKQEETALAWLDELRARAYIEKRLD